LFLATPVDEELQRNKNKQRNVAFVTSCLSVVHSLLQHMADLEKKFRAAVDYIQSLPADAPYQASNQEKLGK
jgi:hypothetical protein